MRALRRHLAIPGPFRRAGVVAALRVLIGVLAVTGFAPQASAQALDEYRIKAAFLVNFAGYTEWPATVRTPLNLCVYGPDPFGAELDRFQGMNVGGRSLAVARVKNVDQLGGCQIVFITRPMNDNLQRVLDALDGSPVLTVADSPGAVRRGAMLNLSTRQSRVVFEANLKSVRGNGLNLSSKLLNLASEVIQ